MGLSETIKTLSDPTRREILNLLKKGSMAAGDIAANFNIISKKPPSSVWNHDIDHVHVLFSAHPKTEFTKFLNAYKSASSRLIKKEYPGIREKLWKESFWSKSFCLITTGGATVEVIRKYIESQGEKD